MDTNFDIIIVTNVENCEFKRLLLTILHTVLCCSWYLDFVTNIYIIYIYIKNYDSNYTRFNAINLSTKYIFKP